MSSTSERSRRGADVGWQRDAKVISIVAIAHFVSHVHIMLLPPIFLLVKDHFDASYAEIAFAITAYNVMSALLQTPAGFLVDRIGARVMLTGGLILSGVAICVAALLPGYWFFLIGYALLGVANTVYHPADYSILSATIDGKRIGKAFSIHTFAGYLGSGVTPAMVIAAVAIWGWNGGFLVAAVLSFAAAILLMVTGSVLPRAPRRGPRPRPRRRQRGRLEAAAEPARSCATCCSSSASPWPMAASRPSRWCRWARSTAPRRRSPISACRASCCSAPRGVLLGGIIADRTPHHERVAAIGFACTSTMAVLLGWVDMPAAVLIFVMSLGGLLNGMIQPSRDMMVRAVTPPGSFGKVFGFVTTGFNLGGMVAPLTYAWLMDHGRAADDLRHRRRVHPAGAGHLHDPPQARRNAGMDSLTPATSSQKEALLRRYGATGLPAMGPWNEVIATMLDHRSVRGYKPDPVPAGTLETMIAAAQSAATSSNMQWTSVIAVSDPAKKKVLAEIAGNQKHIEQCPLYLCWVADMTRNGADLDRAEGRVRDHALARDLHGRLHRRGAGGAERRGGRRIARPPHGLYRRHAQRPGAGGRSCSACRSSPSSCSACVSAMRPTQAAGEVKPRLPQSIVVHHDATTAMPRRPSARPMTTRWQSSPPATRCRPRPGPSGC